MAAFLGEIRMIAGSTAPAGWALCNGQLLPVGQNQALFSQLGTAYGGDGINTFGLPDLRGRVAVSAGNGHVVSERAGEQAHTLSISELPTHAHQMRGSGTAANAAPSSGNVLAVSQALIYLNPNDVAPVLTTIHPQTVVSVGGGQAHVNMQPFMVINFIIALQGVFPG